MKRLMLLVFSLILPIFCAYSDTIKEFTIPTSSSLPAFITTQSDGTIWFTESGADKIGKFSPTTSVFTEYSLPTLGSKPWGIVKGPDGNIWFTERDGDRIGKITSSGTITEYTLTSGSEPHSIISDTSSNVLWFTEYGRNKIGKITTDGTVTEFTIPTSSSAPTGLVKANGDIWFSEETGNKIGRLSTNEIFSEYALPTASSLPNQLFFDSKGTLWVTLSGISKVATIGPTGSINEYASTTTSSSPISIIEGPAGSPLYFTQSNTNLIGKVGFNGTMSTELSIATPSSKPFGLTLDLTGKIWLTEQDGNKISQITPSDSLSITTDSNLPDGILNTPYSTSIVASGGASPYTFSIVSGDGFALPEGFSLSSAGILSGTPMAPSIYLVRIKVTDVVGISILKGFTLTIPDQSLPELTVRISLTRITRTKRTYKIRISNQGGAEAKNFSLKAYASTDKKINAKDTVLLNSTIASLTNLNTTSIDLTVNKSKLSRKRYILTCVNCESGISEEIPTNNSRSISIK